MHTITPHAHHHMYTHHMHTHTHTTCTHTCTHTSRTHAHHMYGYVHIGAIDSLETKFITFVACGSSHSLAIDKEGSLFAWGDNYHGQLGLGSTEQNHPIPKYDEEYEWGLEKGYQFLSHPSPFLSLLQLIPPCSLLSLLLPPSSPLSLLSLHLPLPFLILLLLLLLLLPRLVKLKPRVVQVAAGGSHTIALLQGITTPT